MEKTFGMRHANEHRVIFETPEAAKEAPFVKLADLDLDALYTIVSLYVNRKSMYGDSPCAVAEAPDGRYFKVGFPRHTLNEVKEMLVTPEDVEAIRAGKAGFTVREYVSRSGQTRRTVDWCDIK